MPDLFKKLSSRRNFLSKTGAGIGSLALSSLLQKDVKAVVPGAFQSVAPKAKSVIFFHMTGAPSHLDLFDNKPVLREYDRKPAPKELFEGKRFSFLRGHPKLLGSPYEFSKHGRGGVELSSLLPHLGTVADEMCVIKSMHTTEFNHGPAQLMFHTGLNRQGNPSIGSWTTYGLGSDSENLPAYVVFLTGNTPGAGANLWKAGFLPSVHQGVQLRGTGDPVLYLNSPKGISRSDRRRTLDSIEALNRQNLEQVGDPEIQTRIDQYEMAFRMQSSVPDLVDLSQESAATIEMYGNGEFATVEADNGAAALAHAKGEYFDAILLDVGLPDMDGREVCRLMRRNGVKSPVIMLTAAESDADTILGLDAGANDYVTKPFRLGVLLARLRAQLRQHEQSEDAVFTIGPYTFRPSAKLLVHGEIQARRSA